MRCPHSTTPTRPTRRHSRDDPRDDVGENVGVVECGLISTRLVCVFLCGVALVRPVKTAKLVEMSFVGEGQPADLYGPTEECIAGGTFMKL